MNAQYYMPLQWGRDREVADRFVAMLVDLEAHRLQWGRDREVAG